MMTEPQQVFEGPLRLVRDRDLDSSVDLSAEDGTPEPRGVVTWPVGDLSAILPGPRHSARARWERQGAGGRAVGLMARVADRQQGRLGTVQETLFIPLAARARETRRKRPVLRDPKAVEMVRSIDYDTAKYGRGAGGSVTVLRTAIFDLWVRTFLAEHPTGTVVELGTGLNTRFERVDNGQAHWIDLDLPDTIELRRRFFADTGRRQMAAASVLDEGWLPAVHENPGPYFFVTEGVLVYLPGTEVTRALARIAEWFPGAFAALDTYPKRTFDRQHQIAAKRNMPARWAWACDDPRSLERVGLRLVESATITRPPAALRCQLPARYRYLLPLADPLVGNALRITLFQARS